jgi:hypothetical protein
MYLRRHPGRRGWSEHYELRELQRLLHRPVMMGRIALGIAFAVCALPARGVQLKVAVALREPAAEGVEAKWILKPVGAPASASISLPLHVPGLGGINLPAGSWLVQLDVPGYWHPPKVVNLAEREETIEFRFWPTAIVTGTIAVPNGEKLPKEIAVRFQSSPAQTGDRLPVTEIRCPLADGRFRCEVPAGPVDLRFRARAYMTEFRWNVRLVRGETRDFGVFHLRRGGSVIGSVSTPRGLALKLSEARVVLQPMTAAAVAADLPRASMRTYGALASENGFFVIDGVPPGEYSISAFHGALASADQRIRVARDSETELLEPLLLEPPKTLTVQLDPPLDPGGHPWRVQLTAESLVNGQASFIASELASATGEWRRERLHSGSYGLTVIDAAGGKWTREEIRVADSLRATIHVPMVNVTGSVKLGSRPLAARLHFGGEHGGVSVPLESDRDGAFEGRLPERPDGVWNEVTVTSTSPPLNRTLTNVKVGAHVDLILASTYVEGEVVDEAGKRVTRALVNARGGGEPLTQTDVQTDGTFELHGLAEGAATLQASSPLGDSDPTTVMLREDDVAHVKLVVRSPARLAGRVLSTVGPVAGARVAVVPTDTAPLFTIPVSTDVDGRFTSPLQAGTHEVDVLVEAPGFAFKMFHMSVPDRGIDILLDQLGGSLAIIVPQFDGSDASPQPFLLHGGAQARAAFLREVRFERSAKATVTIRLANVERGSYTLCFVSPGEEAALRAGQLQASRRCVSGFLAPLGDLALTVPGA